MTTAFCILAAGRGARLGELTASINKALLPVDNKAAISHIIEKVPQDCEIVIAVGYDKEKLQEYCLAAHPDRKMEFVTVDNLSGPGSGPAYSLLRCIHLLQRPFYLCNVDTLLRDPVYPLLDQNWIGIDYARSADDYATVDYDVLSNRVHRVRDKGQVDHGMAYVGLMGIVDYWWFWAHLYSSLRRSPEITDIQYVDALNCFYADQRPFDAEGLYARRVSWMDTGSVEGYEKAAAWFKLFKPEVLGMEKEIDEITYKVKNRIIKLCFNHKKNRNRLDRLSELAQFVPKVVYSGHYVLAYEWVKGQTLFSRNCNQSVWLDFLKHCNHNLWAFRDAPPDWEQTCYSFYCDKTWQRMHRYHGSRGLPGGTNITVNGAPCFPVEAYITFLDWDSLSCGIPVRYHGDLQFDNVVYAEDGSFHLIDWRECFGDSIHTGDLYYEFGKIYGGLDLPYDELKHGRFFFEKKGKVVDYDYSHNIRVVSFRFIFEDWLVKMGYDLDKVKTISALIHINMAPLHPGKVGDLLFYHGVYTLDRLYRAKFE